MITNITPTKKKTYSFSLKLLRYIGERHGVDTTMATNIWEAFAKIKKEMYKKPPENWGLVSMREAEKILDGRIHRHTIKKRAEEGIFFYLDSKVYKEEMELVKSMFIMYDYFNKLGAIVETEDVSGRKVYAVIPTAATKSGQNKDDIYFKTVAQLVQHPFIQKWASEINNISDEKLKHNSK